jgi:hypothetical protein
VGNAPLTLDVNVPGAAVSGKVLRNGAPLLGAARSGLFLRASGGQRDGQLIELMVDDAGNYSKVLVAGTYDVIYQGLAAREMPRNYDAILGPPLVVADSPVSLDVDVPATTVSGRVTVDGKTVVATRSLLDGEEGYVGLSSERGGRVELAPVHEGSFQTTVLPGSYELWYRSGRLSDDIPVSSQVRIGSALVAGGAPLTLDVDVPMRRVMGSLTVNGAPVLDPELNGLGALFFDVDQGPLFACTTPLGPDQESLSTDPNALANGIYSQLVVPGLYDLVYGVYRPGPGVPANTRFSVGCVDLR